MKVINLKIQLPFQCLVRILMRILLISKYVCIQLWTYAPFILLITVHAVIVVWCLSLDRQYIPPYKPYHETKSLIDEQLKEQVQLEKSRGCHMPFLDPFDSEVTRSDLAYPKVTCGGLNWVRCYHSECKVVQDILATHTHIRCIYRDLVYITDSKYTYGAPIVKAGDSVYYLRRSDFARVYCKAWRKMSYKSKVDYINTPVKHETWVGQVAGLRSVEPNSSPKGRENATNILIFAFESTPRTGFIRRMPKSYKFLTKVLKATVLKSYNVVGDGTDSALLPMLTGRNPFELAEGTEWRRVSCDQFPMIFYNLTKDGYRTAYMEDDAKFGTFQYRYLGFRRQPTDHYILPYILEASQRRWDGIHRRPHCVGDTPKYKLFMNLTNQYLHLKGKKFIFTFLSEFTHDDFNIIATADDDFLYFLQRYMYDGFLKDTMLVVMGDHGPRYYKYKVRIRDTPRGRLEERLPLMAIVLPQNMKSGRRAALTALRGNIDTLTTPYDMHSTLLDAVGLRKYWNAYKVPGADITRGMTLLEPIPRNRSCSEAGVTPHWCACLAWEHVSKSDPIYEKSSLALLKYINDLTEPYRIHCVRRTLSSVAWVMKIPNTKSQREIYQVKMSVGPGEGDFQASMTYLLDSDTFQLDSREISRISMYNDEPLCISKTHPHLRPYCFCQT